MQEIITLITMIHQISKNYKKLRILTFKLKILIELIILKELEFDKEFINNKLMIKYEKLVF